MISYAHDLDCIGNWYYQEEVALPEKFPQPPPSKAMYTPDLGPHPDKDLATKLFNDGDDGLSLQERLLDHAVRANKPPQVDILL